MFRYALQKYIDSPEKEKAVVFYCEDYVIVKDAYPKSLRHFLVMPRSESVTHTHPLVTLRDPKFVDSMQEAVNHARRLLVEDLIEAGFVEAAEAEHFQKTFIRAGVHSVPSMNNLHIHVITQDFFSPSMKNKKHYNSFTTPFFVDFPEKDVQTEEEESHTNSDSSLESASDQEHLVISGGKLLLGRRKSTPGKKPDVVRDSPLRCTYCQRPYGNQFSKLKAHLAEEFAGKFGVHDTPACATVEARQQ